jgi:hypothetical protein
MLWTTSERRTAMEFVALIYNDEAAWQGLSDDERTGVYGRYMALAEAARAAGVMRGGNELQPADTATTVRIRDGRTAVVDGPYAEVKEALGGYFIFDCGSMEEAIEWASRIPAAETGAVEVRPVQPRPESQS